MKSLKLPLMLLTLVLGNAVAANPLYSWTTKDGTPTYSPDPPPKGVSYVIVGADLQPLQGKSVGQSQADVPAASNTGNIVNAPLPNNAPVNNSVASKNTKPAAPKAAWKPVVYANDPNPQARATATPNPTIAAAVPAEAAPTTQVTAECLRLRQKYSLLESEFANAFSAQQMDDAVVRLHDFRKQNKGSCGL